MNHNFHSPILEELHPCPTVWSIAEQLGDLPHLLVLESSDFHPERGRYSFITADPVDWFQRSTQSVETNENLLKWYALYQSFPIARIPELPPFQAGVAGLFGYDWNQSLESIKSPQYSDFDVPTLALGVYDWVIAWDHLLQRCWLLSTGVQSSATISNSHAAFRIRQVRSWLARSKPPLPHSWKRRSLDSLAPQFPLPNWENVLSTFSPISYRDAIRRTIDYIHAGDCFQINLAQRLLTHQIDHPLALYRRSRDRNPSPFGVYLDLGTAQIISASPERFLSVTNGVVETRPIKGTRPMGQSADEDRLLLEDLLTNPKDRAENIMIVDLLRNDIGKCCDFGSVVVPKICEIESYRHLHHLVSEVRGRLRPRVRSIDLLQACFPGGSITGAPKVRAMEIIAEIEPTRRGAYCGSVGYIGWDGRMDTNILIRTMTVQDGWIQFPVGGGIVADSQPDREYDETLTKAHGMLRSVR
ncbi:aminodeoxychorismate synthase component I [Tuwongella immobilis]|nr:aminodeoxychorismate synthase component I [Tuwongella immobilis]